MIDPEKFKDLQTIQARNEMPDLVNKPRGEFEPDDIRNLQQAIRILNNLQLEASNFGTDTAFKAVTDARKYLEDIVKKRTTGDPEQVESK
jgi:hypothetical protein